MQIDESRIIANNDNPGLSIHAVKPGINNHLVKWSDNFFKKLVAVLKLYMFQHVSRIIYIRLVIVWITLIHNIKKNQLTIKNVKYYFVMW